MIKRPQYTEQITPYIDAPLVKILTGVRRCGKSTILLLIMDELKARGISDQSIIHYTLIL